MPIAGNFGGVDLVRDLAHSLGEPFMGMLVLVLGKGLCALVIAW